MHLLRHESKRILRFQFQFFSQISQYPYYETIRDGLGAIGSSFSVDKMNAVGESCSVPWALQAILLLLRDAETINTAITG